MKDDRHRLLRPRHRDIVGAERLLLGAVLTERIRLFESADRLRDLRAWIGQDPVVADERTPLFLRERIVLIKRQHYIIKAESLGAMDRHDPDLPLLGKFALGPGLEITTEIRKPRSRLHPDLEFRRHLEHVRITLLGVSAPRPLRIRRKLRPEFAEHTDQSARRKRLRHLPRQFARVLRLDQLRQRSLQEMPISQHIPGMFGELHEIDEARERHGSQHLLLAFPDDVLDAATLEFVAEELSERVVAHQHRGGFAATDRISRLERIVNRLDEVVHVRTARLHGLDEARHLRLRRHMFWTLPRGIIRTQPTSGEHLVHRFDDRGTRPIRLH